MIVRPWIYYSSDTIVLVVYGKGVIGLCWIANETCF